MKKLAFLILMVSSCQSENGEPEVLSVNYLLFGHFYGECLGEQCVEIYKLTSTHLYEDTTDNYPSYSSPYEGDFALLDDALFIQVKDLRMQVPDVLLETASGVIGQPDAGDWGGIYFEVSLHGERHYWLIDKMRKNLPVYLHSFVSEIEEKIDLVHN